MQHSLSQYAAAYMAAQLVLGHDFDAATNQSAQALHQRQALSEQVITSRKLD
jgi:hypothetical protein